MTLWGQHGSKVIRGNLILVPLAGSFIYVEPIYLQATQSKLPELKRVIVANENTVRMNNSLSGALKEMYDNSEFGVETVASTPSQTKTDFKKKINTLIQKFWKESYIK